MKPKSKKLKLANQKPTKKTLDDLAREVVRARDKVCRRTGKTDNLQVCHVFSRSNKAVRWDLDNLFLLTAGEHLFWAHKNPVEFTEWVIKQLGEERYQALRMRAAVVGQKIDKWAVRLYLEQGLKKLEVEET